MCTIFKSHYWICYNIASDFYVWVFFAGVVCEAPGLLAPWPGILTEPPALKGEFFTTVPPGKSPTTAF